MKSQTALANVHYLPVDGQVGQLAQLVDRMTVGKDGVLETKIPGLRLFRFSNPTEPDFFIQEPAICFVLQGRKEVYIGDETYSYDPHTCLVASVDLSMTGAIMDATPEKPYFGIKLNVQPKDLATLIVETGLQPTHRDDSEGQALYLSKIEAPLADALLRLVKLLENPAEITIMAPLITREINFRMLQTEQFGILSQVAVGDGKLRRVSHAINWVKQNLASPLKIDDLAKQVNMSASSLHHQFKEVTSLSPLQFQKQLRLQKARQMLAADKTSVEKIAFQVGYESPSQFSREYNRMFGQPPLRDANRIRNSYTDQRANG